MILGCKKQEEMEEVKVEKEEENNTKGKTVRFFSKPLIKIKS